VLEATQSNPLVSGLTSNLVPQPCSLVIFGGAGDLAGRKLIPALYNLLLDGTLPTSFAVMGFERRPLNDEAYREFGREGVTRFSRRAPDDNHWRELAGRMFYASGDFADLGAFAALKARLEGIESRLQIPGNRIFYLAIPPRLIGECVQQLQRAGLVNQPAPGKPFSRIIVEKPVGSDLASARRLNDSLAEVFDESQIYRIDHYLGKETVQNILVMRFGNAIFEPLWNEKYIDHIQITVAEEEGVGTRAGYYEGAGALRDMVQNHIMQLLCLTAMEPPYSMTPEVIHDHKLEVQRCLRPLAGEAVERCVVRGQYRRGYAMGIEVPGYREETGVDPHSATETFVAMKVFVDNWRWAGVPFYLRTGKRLPKRASEIAVQWKQVPRLMFDQAGVAEPNALALRIQPDEGMSLRISTKLPGPRSRLFPVKMDFRYGTTFGEQASPEAYETLLLDVMAGEQTLFMRRDAVEASWAWIDPIRAVWAGQGRSGLNEYPAGTWGPAAAARLSEADGRRWRTL
jgi:glucose-6-phosphate 1-dehydrogenase